MEKRHAIEQFRALALPRPEELAIRISTKLPHVKTNVFEGPVGAATTYDGHHFGIECFFEQPTRDGPDTVALVIDLGTTEGIFQISADVCWGEGQVEAYLLPDKMLVSEAALGKVIEGLPQLSDVLLDAARRGKPRHVA